MDSSPLDPTDAMATTDGSTWVEDIAAAGPSGRPGDQAADVVCEALDLAIAVIRLHVAWHAGVISAEVAMEALDRDIARTIHSHSQSKCSTSTRDRRPNAPATRFGGRSGHRGDVNG
jgi:hypothetical protein